MLHNYGESTGQLFYSILLKRKERQYNTFIQNLTPRTHNKSSTWKNWIYRQHCNVRGIITAGHRKDRRLFVKLIHDVRRKMHICSITKESHKLVRERDFLWFACESKRKSFSTLSMCIKKPILEFIILRRINYGYPPWIFGSKNGFLPIFSPAKSIIERPFQSHSWVNSHLLCPSRHALSAIN